MGAGSSSLRCISGGFVRQIAIRSVLREEPYVVLRHSRAFLFSARCAARTGIALSCEPRITTSNSNSFDCEVKHDPLPRAPFQKSPFAGAKCAESAGSGEKFPAAHRRSVNEKRGNVRNAHCGAQLNEERTVREFLKCIYPKRESSDISVLTARLVPKSRRA